tara:strand:+ start:3749 stop:4231 length:483 start_codon:yes stop_codon:yes gene_type:complete
MDMEELLRSLRASYDEERKGGEYKYSYPEASTPQSSAKQLPEGLLSIMQVPSPDGGKQNMLMAQKGVELPVGRVDVSGGVNPTYRESAGNVTYSIPVGGGELGLRAGVMTDPRMSGTMKEAGVSYSKKMLEDMYINAYITKMLGQNGGSPMFGVNIQGLF